jgi:hypothetical protein
MNKPVLILHILAILALPAFGQGEAEVTRPTPPLLATAEPMARWKVRLTPLTAASHPEAGAPEIREITFSRTGALCQVRSLWSNGQVSESWLAEGYALELPPEYPMVLVTPPGARRSRLLPGAGGFPGVEWLDLKYFREVVTLEGRRCFHYRQEESRLEAWVEVKSGLPLAASDDTYRYHYTYLTAPETPLVLPENFSAALKDYKLAASR